MDRDRWLQEKRAEAQRLEGLSLSEVTPSRRDFRLYVATQRQELAVIARVQRADAYGGAWPDRDLVAYAVACDDAEAAAIAVATDEQRGGSPGLLASVAARVQAAVLRDDLILHPLQLYDARLRGADAAILPAADLTVSELAELDAIASSLHMASVIEIQSSAHLAAALAIGTALIGINADPETTLRLARDVPANRTVLTLGEPRSLDAVRAFRGAIDAVVVSALLLNSTDIAATVAALAAAGSNPG